MSLTRCGKTDMNCSISADVSVDDGVVTLADASDAQFGVEVEDINRLDDCLNSLCIVLLTLEIIAEVKLVHVIFLHTAVNMFATNHTHATHLICIKAAQFADHLSGN